MARITASMFAALLMIGALVGVATLSSQAETLPCGSATASAELAAANTFESQVYYDGTATPSGDTRSFRFCGEDTMYMSGFVSWKGNKDLRVTLVSPDGSTYVFDAYSTVSFEYVRLGAPLAHGDWEMTVTNKGSGKVNYHAAIEFR